MVTPPTQRPHRGPEGVEQPFLRASPDAVRRSVGIHRRMARAASKPGTDVVGLLCPACVSAEPPVGQYATSRLGIGGVSAHAGDLDHAVRIMMACGVAELLGDDAHAAISAGLNPRASQTFSHHCTGFVCVGSYSQGWSPIANASVIASVHWAFVKSRLDPPSITKPGAPSPRSIPGSSRQPKIVPAMKCRQSSLLSRNPCHVMQRDRSPHAALNRRRWSSLSISCQG